MSTSSSDSAVSFTTTVPKTKEYMESLVPPSADQFARIAHVQQEKEVEARRRARQHLRKQSELAGSDSNHRQSQDQERSEAAQVIQKTFRGYRTRRELQGHSLDATTRWVVAVREAQFRQGTKPRGAAVTAGVKKAEILALDDPVDYRPVSARQKWKRASLVARRAGHDDSDSEESDSDSGDVDGATPDERAAARKHLEQAKAERRQAARMMGLQYFLEMVDSKHRYGSNLRMYHEEWKKSDTTENFFYWLDYGQGRNIELDTCPRDRLAREQVRYLSREERQFYLVRVDDEGRLCWVKNGARIDTTEQYKDSIHGIVPLDDATPTFRDGQSPQHHHHHHHHQHPVDNDDDDSNASSSDSVSSAESKREADRAAKYVDPSFDEAAGVKKVTHLSASTIFNQLLRKSVKKNTWIFVADTSFRLYVGIKDSGAFQHSSFLQGSRISAAGLIKIKNGRLSSLSPLSGHYRPPASNFRAFVKNLKEEGVDTSHVSISRSYTILVGLEAYVKTRRKGKALMGKLVRGKDKVLAPEEVKRREEAAMDKSQSAALEREALEREREAEERRKAEMAPGERVLEKIKSLPVRGKGG
ncbi:IQ calmodulin-binding motif protein [Moelleriella libera RCEF 2490]|uniref:IQ calmodulin-binding motif protein n=1 Tax=Moelleriella libera RCEF 2490 TaxID=1081109 RepID=A0A166NID0_9HYPO|nr:IQ calmodulin-binding motif protein [Moelleriella libera RCEF 2490]